MERSLVLLKPDCVQRKLVGRVLSRFEDKGLNIIAMKLMTVTPELAKRHYAEHVEKAWYPSLEGFITSSPIVAMIVEGPGSDSRHSRHGRRDEWAQRGFPERSAVISGPAPQMNLVHASDGPESAVREIDIFFSPTEIHAYEPVISACLRSASE